MNPKLHRDWFFWKNILPGLVSARKQLRWKQSVLAEILEVHPETISRWERRHTVPKAEQLKRWKEVLERGLLVVPAGTGRG